MRPVAGLPLWLGHAGDGRDLRAVLSAGILAVVDLAANESPVAVTRDLVYCRFPLVDGGGNPPWLLRGAVECVTNLLRADVPTLVFCSAGLSRTPAVAGIAVARLRGLSPAEGLSLVTTGGPADVSPSLWADLTASR